MKLRILCVFVIFGLTFTPFYAAVGETPKEDDLPNAWISVADGIDYQKYHLTNPRPINIFVTKMVVDVANYQNLTIDSSIAKGKIASGSSASYGTETVKNMASRYNQVINYWGQSWGSRNKVVVAINGYFFNDWPDGTPWSGVVNSGWYARRYSDYVGDAGFAWGVSSKAFIGDCVYHKASKQFITFKETGYTPNFQGLNVPRSESNPEKIILYTPQYDTDTNTVSTKDDPILEILVEMERPNLILPAPAMATGYIREIRDKQGSTKLPFDHIVLSIWGDVRITMLDKIALGEIQIGDEVGVSQEITDCASSKQNDWTKTYAGLGGDYHFLNNGVIRTDFNNNDAAVPNSRTAIAYKSNSSGLTENVYFIVVDRWEPNVSEGITIKELGYFVRDTLGATDAVTLDSGGSSTMVVNGEVKNNTYCNFNDCRSGVQSDEINPDIEELIDDESADSILYNRTENIFGAYSDSASTIIEPLVGTGIMMIENEPQQKSMTFEEGRTVRTTKSAEVRLGPGTNYASLGTVSEGMLGEIQNHMNQLSGVWAKGSVILDPVVYNSYWWKVDFGNITGWVKEDALTGWVDPGGIKTYLPNIIR